LEKVQRDGKEAETYLERLAQPLRKKGLKVDCVTMPGDPGETIVGYADENDVDLIALSTHGRSGLGRLVFGSVADFVMKKSGLPILLKRPQEAKK
jgi:nucleotide-binding universal stress UspA family protein